MPKLSNDIDSNPRVWQQEQLFDDASDYFDALVAAIEQAQKSIEIDFYIFNFDKTGQKVIAALADAVKRNVNIKVLIDGIGSYQSGLETAIALESNGIEVRIFHPLPWQLSQYHRSTISGNSLIKAFHLIQKINHRDHRKLCIIDGQQLWTGSFNISDQHLRKEQGGDHWRDYGVMVSGMSVLSIQQSFNSLWYKAETKVVKKIRHHFRQYWSNSNRKARRQQKRLLIANINNAQQRIWIVSAYFAPAGKIIKALKIAAKKNIDVKIIVPRQYDIVLFPYLTNSYYHELLCSGIRIYEYLPSFLHAKAAIIDDLYLLGSSNFNHRSSLHDLELDIILKHNHSQQQLCEFIQTDIDNAYEIKLSNLKHGIVQKILGFISRLVRYWM